MAQHGSGDQANNAPIWVGALVNKTPNSANRDALYGNTTADAFIVGQTIGVFAVDAAEIKADGGKIAATGWVLRRAGSGGRAGRVQTEVLVAGGISSDESGDDPIFGNTAIYISIQPASKSVNTHLSTTFSVGAVSVPVASLTYQWQANTGSGFANLTAAGVYSNVDTDVLSISNSAALNTVSYRVLIDTSGAHEAISSGATLTVNAAVITIDTEPLANSVSTGAPATFRVVASVDPTEVTKTYQWQLYDGSFANLAANAIYTDVTTADLVITDSTGLNGKVFRVLVGGVDAATVTSANATLTVT